MFSSKRALKLTIGEEPTSKSFRILIPCLESSVGDNEVLCGLEQDVRERGLRSVVDHVFTRLSELN